MLPRQLRGSRLVFAVAILARAAFFLTFFRSVPVQKVWLTGIETGNVAASLTSGHGFAAPFGIETGATAWIPPVYAGLLALLFRWFGPHSTAAGWAILLLNAFFASLTALVLHKAGRSFLGDKVAPAAAWIWALSPYTIIMCLKVWETSLSALLALAGFLMYWRLQEQQSPRAWAAWGLYWSFTTLVNPGLAIFFPVLSVGAGWRQRRFVISRMALAAIIFCAGLTPWMVRNCLRFHAFFPVRSNFGEELWLGNRDGVRGPNDESQHPLGNSDELASYRLLGEREYVAEKRHAAMSFIADHPGRFVRLTLDRVSYFWRSPVNSLWLPVSAAAFCGLVIAWRKDFLAALPFAVALLLYPVPYYLTHADNWYRHPIEPQVILLALYAISSVFAIRRRLKTADRAGSGARESPQLPSCEYN